MDPLNTFGALNNQAVGYAVPMAPFYLAGQLAHVPVWLTERLWLSLIIAVGFGGLVKLAGALGIGSPASRFLAGLVFALWPTFTIVIGSTSSAALPGMLAPWAVLPLTAAVRGRGGVAWPAARSGAVVLCMSGVNATVTIDALLLPGLFILTYARGRRLVALALCWAGAVAMATAWWALPLLLQGRYAFNFLPYIEQAPTTTGTMSAAAALRGAGQLDRLPQPRHAVAAGGLGPGEHPHGDHRRRHRGRVRPVRAGPAEHAVRGLAPAVGRPGRGRRAGRLRRAARRPVPRRSRPPAGRRARPVPQRVQAGTGHRGRTRAGAGPRRRGLAGGRARRAPAAGVHAGEAGRRRPGADRAHAAVPVRPGPEPRARFPRCRGTGIRPPRSWPPSRR